VSGINAKIRKQLGMGKTHFILAFYLIERQHFAQNLLHKNCYFKKLRKFIFNQTPGNDKSEGSNKYHSLNQINV
jgi:hypothetical protein